MVKHGMMQNKIIIALTGGSGCGKSVVAKAASDLGFKHIDADLIGHDIILKPQKAYYEIVKAFGSGVLDENDEINRRKLGEIVFSDTEKLELLSKITHPAITEKILDMLEERTIIDGAVLYKTPDLLSKCNYIIAVTNSDERRADFICKRDNLDKETAMARIKSQPDNSFYTKNADFIIESDCGIEEMYKKSVDVIKRCISG